MRLRITMEEFNTVIDMYALVELQTFGGNMTWTNKQIGRNRKWAKLVRALS